MLFRMRNTGVGGPTSHFISASAGAVEPTIVMSSLPVAHSANVLFNDDDDGNDGGADPAKLLALLKKKKKERQQRNGVGASTEGSSPATMRRQRLVVKPSSRMPSSSASASSPMSAMTNSNTVTRGGKEERGASKASAMSLNSSDLRIVNGANVAQQSGGKINSSGGNEPNTVMDQQQQQQQQQQRVTTSTTTYHAGQQQQPRKQQQPSITDSNNAGSTNSPSVTAYNGTNDDRDSVVISDALTPTATPMKYRPTAGDGAGTATAAAMSVAGATAVHSRGTVVPPSRASLISNGGVSGGGGGVSQSSGGPTMSSSSAPPRITAGVIGVHSTIGPAVSMIPTTTRRKNPSANSSGNGRRGVSSSSAQTSKGDEKGNSISGVASTTEATAVGGSSVANAQRQPRQVPMTTREKINREYEEEIADDDDENDNGNGVPFDSATAAVISPSGQSLDAPPSAASPHSPLQGPSSSSKTTAIGGGGGGGGGVASSNMSRFLPPSRVGHSALTRPMTPNTVRPQTQQRQVQSAMAWATSTSANGACGGGSGVSASSVAVATKTTLASSTTNPPTHHASSSALVNNNGSSSASDFSAVVGNNSSCSSGGGIVGIGALNTIGRPVTRQKHPRMALDLFGNAAPVGASFGGTQRGGGGDRATSGRYGGWMEANSAAVSSATVTTANNSNAAPATSSASVAKPSLHAQHMQQQSGLGDDDTFIFATTSPGTGGGVGHFPATSPSITPTNNNTSVGGVAALFGITGGRGANSISPCSPTSAAGAAASATAATVFAAATTAGNNKQLLPQNFLGVNPAGSLNTTPINNAAVITKATTGSAQLGSGGKPSNTSPFFASDSPPIAPAAVGPSASLTNAPSGARASNNAKANSATTSAQNTSETHQSGGTAFFEGADPPPRGVGVPTAAAQIPPASSLAISQQQQQQPNAAVDFSCLFFKTENELDDESEMLFPTKAQAQMQREREKQQLFISGGGASASGGAAGEKGGAPMQPLLIESALWFTADEEDPELVRNLALFTSGGTSAPVADSLAKSGGNAGGNMSRHVSLSPHVIASTTTPTDGQPTNTAANNGSNTQRRERPSAAISNPFGTGGIGVASGAGNSSGDHFTNSLNHNDNDAIAVTSDNSLEAIAASLNSATAQWDSLPITDNPRPLRAGAGSTQNSGGGRRASITVGGGATTIERERERGVGTSSNGHGATTAKRVGGGGASTTTVLYSSSATNASTGGAASVVPSISAASVPAVGGNSGFGMLPTPRRLFATASSGITFPASVNANVGGGNNMAFSNARNLSTRTVISGGMGSVGAQQQQQQPAVQLEITNSRRTSVSTSQQQHQSSGQSSAFTRVPPHANSSAQVTAGGPVAASSKQTTSSLSPSGGRGPKTLRSVFGGAATEALLDFSDDDDDEEVLFFDDGGDSPPNNGGGGGGGSEKERSSGGGRAPLEKNGETELYEMLVRFRQQKAQKGGAAK